jgi:hypothetical protein
MKEAIKVNQELKAFRSLLLEGMMVYQKDKKVLAVLNKVLKEFELRFPDIKD